LKQGFPNFHVNQGQRLPGEFRTMRSCPLYLIAVGVRTAAIDDTKASTPADSESSKAKS
jgi:hypothetical protein